jgi:hypothetical protein
MVFDTKDTCMPCSRFKLASASILDMSYPFISLRMTETNKLPLSCGGFERHFGDEGFKEYRKASPTSGAVCCPDRPHRGQPPDADVLSLPTTLYGQGNRLN